MKIWETFITIGSTFRTFSSRSVQQDKKRGYKLELNESVRAAHTSDLETCLIIRCPLDFSLRVPEKLAGCSRRGSLNLARWVSQQCVALRMSGTHFVYGAKLHKCPRTASTCSVIWRRAPLQSAQVVVLRELLDRNQITRYLDFAYRNSRWVARGKRSLTSIWSGGISYLWASSTHTTVEMFSDRTQ